MELLAPAGDFDSLKMAVFNGANAVYLGVNQFNARNNIKGFNIDDIESVVNFCHLWDVKVYLALNILFKDEELQDAMDIVFKCNNYGVDAFIVQDIGLAFLIKNNYPNVVLHASTQMAVHNLSGAKVLKEMGFQRVVLSRETTPEEIKKITQNCDIEIEFFCQGALCICFSGNCYMCSYMTGKSGNRGVCSQFCRLPFEATDGNKINTKGFLLSAKDICMIDKLKEMQDIGCSSLKIEGRARRPYYVGQACKTYRKLLDNEFSYTKKDLTDLSLAFNRGYTPAYFNSNDNIISQFQNHIGVKIGCITKVNRGKKFNEVFVKSLYNVTPKSSLKIFDENKEVGTVAPFDIKKFNDGFVFTTTSDFKSGNSVNLINDFEIESKFNVQKKLKIHISVEAYANKPIKFSSCIGEDKIEKSYFILDKAISSPFSLDNCVETFNRNADFEVSCDLNTDDVFVVKSKINEARNDYLKIIKEKILNNYKKYNKLIILKNKININNEKIKNNTNIIDNSIIYNQFKYVVINSVTELENAIYDNETYVIFSPELYDDNTLDSFARNMKGQRWFLDLPNFALERDIQYYMSKVKELGCGVVVNNIFALNFDTAKIGGSFLNVYNSFTMKVLNQYGIACQFIAELPNQEINRLKCENVLYCKRENVYMTLRFCPYKHLYKCNCDNCKCTNKLKYVLNGKVFKVKRKKCSSCTFYLTD